MGLFLFSKVVPVSRLFYYDSRSRGDPSSVQIINVKLKEMLQLRVGGAAQSTAPQIFVAPPPGRRISSKVLLDNRKWMR